MCCGFVLTPELEHNLKNKIISNDPVIKAVLSLYDRDLTVSQLLEGDRVKLCLVHPTFILVYRVVVNPLYWRENDEYIYQVYKAYEIDRFEKMRENQNKLEGIWQQLLYFVL